MPPTGWSPLVTVSTRPCVFSRLVGSRQDDVALINSLNVDEAVVDERVGQAVKRLWVDVGVQQAYEMRAKFQLNDSAA